MKKLLLSLSLSFIFLFTVAAFADVGIGAGSRGFTDVVISGQTHPVSMDLATTLTPADVGSAISSYTAAQTPGIVLTTADKKDAILAKTMRVSPHLPSFCAAIEDIKARTMAESRFSKTSTS